MPYKDPVVRRAYMRAYKKKNPRCLDPNYDRAAHANRRARKYGAPGSIGVEIVREVLSAGRCHYCNETHGRGKFKDLGIDHVIPLHLGGPNERSNLVACCHECNVSKHRGDRPGKWARFFDACVECGRTNSKHAAHGLCQACYQRGPKRARLSESRR